VPSSAKAEQALIHAALPGKARGEAEPEPTTGRWVRFGSVAWTGFGCTADRDDPGQAHVRAQPSASRTARGVSAARSTDWPSIAAR